MAEQGKAEKNSRHDPAEERTRKRRKAQQVLFILLALGNLPTLFRDPLEYLGALVLCFLLAVAVIRILY